MTIAGIALFLLLAQNAPPLQPAPPAASASIEGVVARDVTGESLSKVTITLTEVRNPTGPPTDLILPVAPNSPEFALVVSSLNSRNAGPPQIVTTTADGRFLFENLKPGTYSLKATLGGYAPTEYGQRGLNGRGMSITLKPGQKLQGVSLTMTPGGTITGRVFDANGDPLGRALVQAQKQVYEERGRTLVTVQAVPTDDRGEYRLFWLPPGKYYISAMPSDDRQRSQNAMIPTSSGSINAAVSFTSTSTGMIGRQLGINGTLDFLPGTKVTSRIVSNGDEIEEAEVPVFYPAAADVSAATPVEVRPGGLISGIDIATRPTRVFRIRARIVNGSGQSVTTSDMILMPKNGSTAGTPIRIPASSNSPNFEFAGVLPGSYYLLGFGTEGPGMPAVGLTSVDVQASNLENVIIRGSPPFAIQGHISRVSTIATSATPAQSVIVRVEPQLSGVPNALLLGANLSVRQDNFVLPLSAAGDYRVSVSSPPNTYVQSVRFGGQDVLRDGLHVDGQTNETLEVVVSPNAGRLEGDVTADRKKFPNATVVLVPSNSLRQQTSLYQTVQSNTEGHFTFESIAPGTYKVFAWEDIESLAWFDAEFMRGFENRGTEILIRESAKENIEIPVIPR